jgi:hypothetical protein
MFHHVLYVYIMFPGHSLCQTDKEHFLIKAGEYKNLNPLFDNKARFIGYKRFYYKAKCILRVHHTSAMMNDSFSVALSAPPSNCYKAILHQGGYCTTYTALNHESCHNGRNYQGGIIFWLL